jgi:hypothetical protein
MHKRTLTRAAGVSPPWFGDANGVPRASYIVQQRPNTQSRAAGVSPPWFEHHDNGHNTIATDELAPCKRAALRPSTVAVTEMHFQERCRKVAGDCHRCAHKRRCSRGSEPTGGLRPRPGLPPISGLRRCNRGSEPTGGLRPPLLCWCTDVCRRNSDFCGAQTHVHKSGGRQPAVVRSYDRCAARGECCSARSEHTTKSGGRQPAVVRASR